MSTRAAPTAARNRSSTAGGHRAGATNARRPRGETRATGSSTRHATRRPELSSRDDRFAARFTAYAASASPGLWILRGHHAGGCATSPAAFRRAVERDAALHWQDYVRVRRSGLREVRGLLAAWLADQALLGRAGEGWRGSRRRTGAASSAAARWSTGTRRAAGTSLSCAASCGGPATRAQ